MHSCKVVGVFIKKLCFSDSLPLVLLIGEKAMSMVIYGME